MDALVSTEWLAGELGSPGLIVLDASYTSTLPGAPPRDPRAEHLAGHIPGARFLDLDTLVDETSPLPSTLPQAAMTAERLARLGVSDDVRIVLYDDSPHHTSCRAWWVLRMAGIEAAILDGGLGKWKAERRPLATGTGTGPAGTVVAGPALGQVRTLADMRANLDGAEQVADARSAARFTGAEGDGRPGSQPGHIPGSRNTPYNQFFEADGTWKRGDALRSVFGTAGIDLDRPLVATCGSGITAAVIVFAAHLLGHDAALYDGSWSEWGSDPSTPKDMGPA